MKVDVVMCTWNSNMPYFVKCLDSIKREVPVHHFILIDRFSTDGTLEKVRKIFPNAKIKQSNARLAVNRKLGIQLVDTEFYASIDSDIELCNGWFKRIVSHLEPTTGGINVSLVHMHEHLTAWSNWLENMMARFKKEYAQTVVIATSKNPPVMRGGAGNTLIRTRLVKDWDPPAILSAFEDHMIYRHILRKGYTWKKILEPLSIHYGVPSAKDWLMKGRWCGAGMRLVKYENMTTSSLIKEASKLIIWALLASAQTKQPMILPYVTARQIGIVQGWVNWIKYLDPKRPRMPSVLQ